MYVSLLILRPSGDFGNPNPNPNPFSYATSQDCCENKMEEDNIYHLDFLEESIFFAFVSVKRDWKKNKFLFTVTCSALVYM